MEHVFSTRGKHCIVDAYGIKPELLDDINYLKQLGKAAILKSGAVFVNSVDKKFHPYGATLLFLLEESHLSFHTFLETVEDTEESKRNSFLSLDMYTCGDADPEIAVQYILEQLQPDPNRIYRQMLIRGVE